MSYDYNKEREEAIRAGKLAKKSLEQALDALDSASGWGILDIFGGGLISTLAKHSKMDDASEYIEEAKKDLKAFSNELDDIDEYANIDLSTGDFWGFADWFFDGLFSDLVMQDRIDEAISQVKQAIRKVDSILNRL